MSSLDIALSILNLNRFFLRDETKYTPHEFAALTITVNQYLNYLNNQDHPRKQVSDGVERIYNHFLHQVGFSKKTMYMQRSILRSKLFIPLLRHLNQIGKQIQYKLQEKNAALFRSWAQHASWSAFEAKEDFGERLVEIYEYLKDIGSALDYLEGDITQDSLPSKDWTYALIRIQNGMDKDLDALLHNE